MITLDEWNGRIDAFIEEENRSRGREVPVHRIYCQDDSDRSGGGLYNETVTIDTIGRFARAIGDSNPLYSDPGYPTAVQAPPLLECCICSTFIGGRLPRLRGISVYDAGTRWERFAPIRPGDSFTAKTVFLGIEEITKEKTKEITREGVKEITKPGRAARLLIRSHEISLYNQRGELVSRLTARSVIRCAAPAADPDRSAGQAEGTAEIKAVNKAEETSGRPRYSREQLEEVYANLDAQFDGLFRRGSRPRFWEDVKIGDELPEQVVGPYDESDGQSLMAAIGAANAFATKWGSIRSRRKHGLVDPETGALRHPIDRHISDTVAKAQGMPRAIVSGIHSQALLAKSAGDWMGDAGFLVCLDCRCRKPLYYGDLSFQRGRVTAKEERGERFFVRLYLEAVRQDGVIHTEAEALVELPSRMKQEQK
ncbi:MAG: MaoC family dehydratase N-terminal domain-containing protein [Eubacteriales bacterium]|nr:MaoC family dehydratase N-terminal domain-containing protein [Eubacteriales bacterium]